MDFDLDAISNIDLDEEARKMTKAFLQGYEVIFKDPYNTIDPKTVKIRLKNLSGFSVYRGEYDELSRYYSSLVRDAKAYYYARKYPYADMVFTVEKFGNLFDNEQQKKDYAKFCFMYRNVQMGKLLKSIKDKQKIKVKPLMTCSDGIGFNILHYAIIMGDNETVSECLKNYRKIVDHHRESCATYSYNPFDYVIIAEFIGNTEFAEQINETIGSVGRLLRTKKSLERYIGIREGLHSIAQLYSNNMGSSIREARRNTSKYDYANQVKYKDLQDEKEEFDEELNNDSEFIDKLKEDLEEVERQIQYERESFYPNLREKVLLFSRESDPYISAIRNFYEKPDDLYKALNASVDDVKIVWGDGFFYYSIKDVFEFDWEKHEYSNHKKNAENNKSSSGNSSNRTSHSKRTSNEKRERKCSRPYVNRWFSPEAYKDYKKLRIEYRELAKKYHPDNNTGCEDIFKEINSEREIIMERLR